MALHANEKELFPIFCSQLKDGCGLINCKNENCRSSQNFKYNDVQNLNDTVNELIKKYRKDKTVLCKYISPLIATYDLHLKLYDFREAIKYFISGKELMKKKIESLCKGLTKKSIFSYTFLSGNGLLKKNDLKFDMNLIFEFKNELDKRNGEFLKMLNKEDLFNDFVEKLFTKNISESLQYIRAIMLVSILNPCINIKNEKIIQKIFEKFSHLSKEAKKILYNNLVKYNMFIKYMNDFAQKMITEYIKIKKPDPHSITMHSFAIYIEFLSYANMAAPKQFDSEIFVNNDFSSLVFPDLEISLYLDDVFSYIEMSSILNKKTLFSLIRQDQKENSTLSVIINRNNILEDGFTQIFSLPPEKLEKRLVISFKDEKTEDDGGVTREFFFLMSNVFFSKELKLFELTESGDFYWFSHFKNNNMDYYKKAGIFVRLALMNSVVLPIRFPLVLYKKLYDIPLNINDLDEIYPKIKESIQQLTKLQDEDLEELYFSVTEKDENDKIIEVPLVPGGVDKKLTKENVPDYINEYVNYLLNSSVEEQFSKFKEGFFIIDDSFIFKNIKYTDLDVLISGKQELSWEDLKLNVTYSNGYDNKSETIIMFWNVFDQMNDKQKSQILQFITGISRAPAGGLKTVRICIQKSSDVSKFPTAHTCFNLFVLPDYKDIPKIKHALEFCAENCEGFGLI